MAGIIEPNKLYTVSELAKLLGLSERTVLRVKAAGRFPYFKVGRKVFFLGSDLLAKLPTQK